MSEVDLLPIYQAIKYRLKAVDPAHNLQAYDHVPGASEWPGAFVLPPEVGHEGLGDDWMEVQFDIVVLVSSAIDSHQLKLLEYQSTKGERSIARAFRSEPTLGGLVGDIRVTGSRPLSYEEQAGYMAFGCVFSVKARIG